MASSQLLTPPSRLLNLLGFPRYDDCIYIVEYGICSVVAQSLSMHFWDGDMYRKYGKKTTA